MAEFDPRQLDLLEDALDRLPGAGLDSGADSGALDELDELEALGLSPALTERLADYRDVLALCREALPLEEPPADALADVIAEAHAVSRRPKLREPEGGRWARFWERWRGTLVPGLALAGTAAAVLLLLEPEQELSRAGEHLSDEAQREQAEQAEQAETDSSRSEPASEPSVDDSDADAELDQDPEPTPTPESKSERPTGTSGEPTTAALGTDKRKAKAKPSKAAVPESTPSAPPSPLSKDETWTALERANADRRRGDCDRARARYEQVIAASSDSLAVARAQAGIGLCLEQDRRTREAQTWFDRARSDSAGIDAWIASERDEQPLPGASKKNAAINQADAFDESL